MKVIRVTEAIRISIFKKVEQKQIPENFSGLKLVKSLCDNCSEWISASEENTFNEEGEKSFFEIPQVFPPNEHENSIFAFIIICSMTCFIILSILWITKFTKLS